MASKKTVKNPYPVRIGDEGDLVKDIQERLALLGSKVKVTGVFNIGTMSAVKSWQKKHNLQVSGEMSAFQYQKLTTMTDPMKKPVKKKVTRKKA